MLDRKVVREFLEEELRETEIPKDIKRKWLKGNGVKSLFLTVNQTICQE